VSFLLGAITISPVVDVVEVRAGVTFGLFLLPGVPAFPQGRKSLSRIQEDTVVVVEFFESLMLEVIKARAGWFHGGHDDIS
jgi:hypothetical protein